ncbi:hypothetical protein [Xylanibacter muris]|uniref:Glycosyl hydrolase family 43 n=1 Tax=Xylanibacter muris TaxID=2736290 RepID=A0ABX2AKS0_9BACT|nr:hypothetical protein [Xylanibacter muris]NPD91365.1 hypothetical protein [Xylanibacter muris]
MKRICFLLWAVLTFVTGKSQNPYLPLWEHLPDGEPRVFEDPDNPGKYRAYIIGSHDITYTGYCGNDIRMWSAPVEDLSQWRDEGPIFKWFVDGQWDTMFAPDLVEVKDKKTGKKTYWLYPHSRGWRRVAMVCRGDRPDGPFTPVNLTPDGRQCLPGSLIDFDPSVFIENITDKRDKDFDRGFRAYVFYGFRHSTAFELDQDNMYAVRPGTEVHDYFIPASERYGVVRDPEGTEYPALYKDQNPGDFNFFEASSIRQVGNKYVMVFSGYSGPDYGLGSTNSALRYAFGDSPLGPWRSGGVLVDSRGVVPNEDGSHLTTTNAAHNTHGSLQEINGQWYVFYHRPPRGFGNARQAMVAPVKITWDKKKVADGGMVRITAYDPYAKNNEWTASASDGMTYTGAEVTSEGFQIFGLPPFSYYSAGLACYMTGNQWMQDNHDVWNNGMDLAGITNRGVVGFKYFGFGGLDKDAKGVRAFAGTKKGDGTVLCLDLTSGGHGAFKIHVMLDGPYANSTWKGREIGVIDVPANAQGRKVYSVAVPEVEGLKGKHAIYLVAEGPEVKQPKADARQARQPQRPVGLFDLHGIGFAKADAPFVRPVVPVVTITADGKKLNIPATPIRTTNANGLTDAIRYQVYAPLTDKSVIKVEASDPSVEYSVSPIVEGRATVKCMYDGKEKIYLIN